MACSLLSRRFWSQGTVHCGRPCPSCVQKPSRRSRERLAQQPASGEEQGQLRAGAVQRADETPLMWSLRLQRAFATLPALPDRTTGVGCKVILGVMPMFPSLQIGLGSGLQPSKGCILSLQLPYILLHDFLFPNPEHSLASQWCHGPLLWVA